jgi:hypothetical protein
MAGDPYDRMLLAQSERLDASRARLRAVLADPSLSDEAWTRAVLAECRLWSQVHAETLARTTAKPVSEAQARTVAWFNAMAQAATELRAALTQLDPDGAHARAGEAKLREADAVREEALQAGAQLRRQPAGDLPEPKSRLPWKRKRG